MKRSADLAPFVLKKRLCTDLDDANLALKEAMGLAKYQSKYIVRYEDVYLEPVRCRCASTMHRLLELSPLYRSCWFFFLMLKN